MKKFQIHDFIEDYPSQEDEDIQWKTAARKEFFELQSGRGSQSSKKGRFFNHQEAFLRYARQYDRIFNIQGTGTGKTGGIINLAEFYKKNNHGVKRVYVIEPGKSTKDAFKEQIKKLSSPDEYVNKRIANAMKVDGGQKIIKNNLNRLIGEWYSVDTYKVFAKENLSDQQIIDSYSDCIFFLDEVHWLRNTTGNDGSTKREKDEVYDYFWRIFHLAQRTKVIIATATPMVNETVDFVPLINLLLPADRQLPDYIDYDYVTLEQMEPYFRGLFTFIRFDNKYINVIDEGERIEKFKHKMEFATDRRTGAPPLPSVKKEIVDGKIVTVDEPEYDEVQVKDVKFSSYVRMVMLRMSDHQYKVYKKHSNIQKNFGHSAIQASLFVFPNGMIGHDAENTYLDFDEKKNMVFRKNIRRRVKGKFIEEESLDNFFKPEKPKESLENLKRMSTKFHFFIEKEYKRSFEDKPGSSFCFIKAVNAAGAKLLALLLKVFGFDPLKNVGSAYDTRSGRIRGIKKKKRYALLTGETPDVQAVIDLFNSPDNMDGEYVQILIGSDTVGVGVSLKNVKRGYLMTPGWHESGMYQALSRFIRAESHREMYLREGKKVDVSVYRLAAVHPKEGEEERRIQKNGYDSATIDVQNYLKSEEKDIKNKRIMRFFKICAWDAYLNYDRNVLPTDVSFSPDADYDQKYFKIWKAEGPPSGLEGLPSPKRTGIALNQGPNAHDIGYTTYNILYSNEIVENVKKEILTVFSSVDVIDIEDFKKILKEKKIIANDYTFYNAIQEMVYNMDTIRDSKNINSYILAITGNMLHLKRFNFHQTSRISTEKDVYFDFPYLPLKGEEEKIGDIYKKIEKFGTKKEEILTFYKVKQDYTLFQKLLEDSLIRVRRGDPLPVNNTIIDLLDNYILETKIPHNYIKKVNQALSNENKTGQGRLRGDKSVAGLKYINLDDIDDPGYNCPEEGPSAGGKKVYLHFYRPSEKTGFGITSILEGKNRSIRILEGEEFRDADIAESFVYNYLFNQKYDVLMKRYRESKYYGLLIYRGGETEKNLSDRERSFFRIVDNSNERNKGLVCKSAKVRNLNPILEFLDTEKKYQKYLEEKVKKTQLCDLLQKLFRDKNLLFTSL